MEDLRLHDAVICLAAAGLVIPVVKKFHISPVLGFLLVGLAVGPFGLARFAEDQTWLRYLLITDVSGVRALAELGVVFLLFMIGLELSAERLWTMRRLVFGMGSAQILLTGTAIGFIAWSFGNDVRASIVLGSCLALSSTAIVIQLLMEQGRFGSPVGQSSFAVLLAQDMAVVPILFLVGIFGAETSGSIASSLGLAFGEALVAIGLIFLVGRVVVRPTLRFVASAESPELFMAITLLLIIATSAATHAAGLSAALGAFLAGLLVAESEYHHEIKVNIEPFKGLFLGLFFMSVAMWVDLSEILNEPVWIALSVFGLFALKSAIAAGLGRLFGFSWAQAAEMGLILGQGGEFAFVVVGLAVGLGLLGQNTAQFMLIVVSATMFLTPFVASVARKVGRAMSRHEQTADQVEMEFHQELAGHVVIVGYGRTGRLLGELLSHQMIGYVALDLDVDRVARGQAQGVPIFYGDASRPSMLNSVGVSHALAVVICTDDPETPEKVLASASQIAPAVPVIIRAHDGEHASELLALGAAQVVPEVLEAGLELAHLTLEQVGIPTQVARELVEARRIDELYQMRARSGEAQ